MAISIPTFNHQRVRFLFGSASSHLVATPAEAWQDDASFIKAWSGDVGSSGKSQVDLAQT